MKQFPARRDKCEGKAYSPLLFAGASLKPAKRDRQRRGS